MQVENNEEKAQAIQKQIDSEKIELKKLNEQKAMTNKEYEAQKGQVKDAEFNKKHAEDSLKKLQDGIEKSKREANEQEMKLHEVEIKKLSQEKEVIGEAQ